MTLRATEATVRAVTKATRRVLAGSLSIALIGIGIGVAALRDEGAGTPPPASSESCAVTPAYAQQSVGDSILSSDLIALGRVVSIGAPVWNSADGKDWTTEFEEDPTAYETTPITVFPIRIWIDDVLHATADGATVAVGDTIEVLFLDPGLLQPGDTRVFPIDRTEMYGAMPEPRDVWVGHAHQGTWIVDGDLVTPVDDIQAYSVASAILQGKVDGVVDQETWRGALTLPTLRAVIDQEVRTSCVDVAGFTQWPYEPALEKYERATA